MNHLTREGEPRLVRDCTYPLTAQASVDRIYTDLAVIDVTPRGFVVAEMIAGMTLEQLQTMTGATLHMPEA
jgi:3-oxoadipate CoA-transferase beta subunit